MAPEVPALPRRRRLTVYLVATAKASRAAGAAGASKSVSSEWPPEAIDPHRRHLGTAAAVLPPRPPPATALAAAAAAAASAADAAAPPAVSILRRPTREAQGPSFCRSSDAAVAVAPWVSAASSFHLAAPPHFEHRSQPLLSSFPLVDTCAASCNRTSIYIQREEPLGIDIPRKQPMIIFIPPKQPMTIFIPPKQPIIIFIPPKQPTIIPKNNLSQSPP